MNTNNPTSPISSQLRTEFFSSSLSPIFLRGKYSSLSPAQLSLSLSLSPTIFGILNPSSNQKMNKSGLIAASVAAASAISISSSSSSINTSSFNPCMQDSRLDGVSHRNREKSSSVNSSSKEKFAPRFDGLRFIETLVTAHR